jgi:hypothetical protein
MSTAADSRIYRPRFFSRKGDASDFNPKKHIAKFAALARYPAGLNVLWLAALSGTSPHTIKDWVTEARHAGYIKIIDAQLKKPNHNEPLYYENTEKAETFLIDRGFTINRHEFTGQSDHRVDSCKARASIELGTSDDFKVYSWPTLIEMGKIPKKTAEMKTPVFAVGRDQVRPDTYPFVIDHGSSRYFILGIEVDRSSASINSYQDVRSAINTKYRLYFEFLKEQMYRDALEFRDCIILFTTTSMPRLRTMAKLWHDMTERKPSLRDNIAFQMFKDEPTGWAIKEPWILCDGTLLDLSQP